MKTLSLPVESSPANEAQRFYSIGDPTSGRVIASVIETPSRARAALTSEVLDSLRRHRRADHKSARRRLFIVSDPDGTRVLLSWDLSCERYSLSVTSESRPHPSSVSLSSSALAWEDALSEARDLITRQYGPPSEDLAI